ncbi:hypothetical protein OG563_27825 [Nocardia vinacea]|uniref:Uncharacterized protein n=1 Tax=Nocardia vinacea TaxID=96468 RepID=A0ABZ1YJA2_9NOCA|nr:hypothetical protein [Nocardia vinacea]
MELLLLLIVALVVVGVGLGLVLLIAVRISQTEPSRAIDDTGVVSGSGESRRSALVRRTAVDAACAAADALTLPPMRLPGSTPHAEPARRPRFGLSSQP